MTVSRVINNSGYVGKDTRRRIEEAIAALHYRPNQVAKSLVTRRSNTIAYVMVNIADPFHNVVKQGFESVAYHGGYTSVICGVHSERRQQDYIDSFLENRTGGVAFHHLAITERQIGELKESGIKCVLIDNEYDIRGVSSVNTDNYRGGWIAGEHLIERGHTRIGCVHGVFGPYESDSEIPYEDTFQFNIWRQRTAGFTDALKAHGLEPAGMFAGNGRADISETVSCAIVDAALGMDDPPTALYCENDIIALSILKRLQELKVKVPEQMAVIGHDGLDMIHMLHPVISTVAQPRYDIGRVAAEILLDQIENAAPERHVVLTPTLVTGETT